jgi:hypothetical protein
VSHFLLVLTCIIDVIAILKYAIALKFYTHINICASFSFLFFMNVLQFFLWLQYMSMFADKLSGITKRTV